MLSQFIASVVLAAPKPTPSASPTVVGADKFSEQANKATVDFSFFTQFPVIWTVAGIIAGAMVGIIVLTQGLSGGWKWGMAHNDINKVKDAKATLANAGIGSAVILGVFAVAGGLVATIAGLWTS